MSLQVFHLPLRNLATTNWGKSLFGEHVSSSAESHISSLLYSDLLSLITLNFKLDSCYVLQQKIPGSGDMRKGKEFAVGKASLPATNKMCVMEELPTENIPTTITKNNRTMERERFSMCKMIKSNSFSFQSH